MGDLEIKVGKELVAPIIEARIHAAIIEGLGGQEELLSKVVSEVLSRKVDPSSGKPSTYGGNRDIPLVEYLAKDAIRKCAEKAVESWVESSKDKILKGLEAQMKRRAAGFAKIMMDGLERAMKSRWDFNVDVNFNEKG